MTPHQILTICIRLIAIIWALYTLFQMTALLALNSNITEAKLSPTFIWAQSIFQLLICAIFWIFPRSIAVKLLPDKDGDKVAPAASITEWQVMFISLIGIWVLAKAVPDAAYWITFFKMAVNMRLGIDEFPIDNKVGMITTLVELVIGAILLFRAKRIAKFINQSIA